VLIPFVVVTVTWTVPAAPGGAVAVIWVGRSIVNVAVAEPNCAAVAVERPVPVIVTVVPPTVGPADGLTPDTVGGAPWMT
jgi:hypothetical protein